jgi:hypothetical protein
LLGLGGGKLRPALITVPPPAPTPRAIWLGAFGAEDFV